ncbi:MAG: metallophosphoesterase [Kiritimatiellia bacterium]
MKQAIRAACALALLLVARGESPPLAPGAETLVILPDTEVYASRRPEVMKAQLAWIRDQTGTRRIKGVLLAGDITNRNTEPEWRVAREAFESIGGRLPYVLCLGNHDYDGQTGRTSLANRFFPVAELRRSAAFGGVFEEDRLDNHFQWINLHGRKWLVLSLEFGPRPAVLEWANRVLEQNAAHPVIVLTHGYLFRDNERFDHRRGSQRATPHGAFGDGADGEEIWQQVLRRHANVMLVVCGHVASGLVGYRRDEGDHGNTVHQMMCDYEKLRGGGQGFLRLLEFHPDGRTVQVRTYSPVTGGGNPVNAALEEFVFELRDAPSAPSTGTPVKEMRAGLDPDPKTWLSRPTRTLTSETKQLPAEPVNRYGGWTGETARATGFFRTERDARGRWRLIDPDGGAFISIGVNSVRPNPTTAGRRPCRRATTRRRRGRRRPPDCCTPPESTRWAPGRASRP